MLNSTDRSQLDVSQQERDLGVIIDNQLSFGKEIEARVTKANKIAGLIRRTFTHLDNNTFVLLFTALVRPHLEYAAVVWEPRWKKHIQKVEGVQLRATRMLPGMSSLDYPSRLKRLNLPSLAFRRLRGGMIET